MADGQQPSWPPYLHGMQDHLHAIGTIITTWNLLENAYQALLQLAFPCDQVSGQHACELLSLEQQAKLLRAQLPSKTTSEEMALVEYFIKCANICKDNRNAIAHSQYNPVTIDGKLLFHGGMSKDRTKLNQYTFDVSGLREMADANYIVFMFGLDTWSAIGLRHTKQSLPHDPFWASQPLALPQRPAQPRSWDQIRGASIPSPSPPQS